MSQIHLTAGEAGQMHTPQIRHIGTADIITALRRGLDDFREKPSHYAFVCLIYPLAGIVMIAWSNGVELLPMVYPLMSGFALLGPLLALGLMEISRRRERGEEAGWADVPKLLQSTSIGSLLAMSGYLLALFVVWLVVARAIFTSTIGDFPSPDFFAFFSAVLAHPNAMTLIVWGNVIGFCIAVVALVISIVAFPMLLDRDCGVATAIHTSIRASMANPLAVALWGGIVAGSLVVGMATMMVGLIVIVPVLGHASWHLYRSLVRP